MRKILVALMVLALSGSPAFATPENEAKEMVERGVAFIEANGKDKAFAEFTNKDGQFIDRHLYLFIVDFNGVTLAHGGNDKLVGKDMSKLKDADNRAFIAEMIELAQTKGSGWVDYKWVNPTTTKIEPKTTYIQRVDDYFVGCGTYKR